MTEETKFQTVRVERDGQKDLTFEGVVLADTDEHSHEGPKQNRWGELTIYRTKAGAFVVAYHHHTCWQGESDRYDGEVCKDGPAVYRAVLRLTNGDQGDPEYLSTLAYRALDTAGFGELLGEKVE